MSVSPESTASTASTMPVTELEKISPPRLAILISAIQKLTNSKGKNFMLS